MMKKARKLLCMLLTLAMLIGAIPMGAMAADATDTLTLNEEKSFAIAGEEDSAKFTFTADEAGTYILYFKDISAWPIGLEFPYGSEEYHHEGAFQGHVVELTAGDSASLTFRYPEFTEEDQAPEGYVGFTGIVGVAKKADTFDGFFALEEPDQEGVYSFGMQPELGMNFYTNDPFCYGVTWSVTVDDVSILTLDTDHSVSEPTSYHAVFRPNQPGETNVTVSATYEGTTVENTYRIRITEDGGGGGDSWYEFSTFEELKQLIADNPWGDGFYYTYVGTTPLVISEDIEVNGIIIVPYTVGISGIEHITFAQDWQRMEIEAVADSSLSLVTLLEEMSAAHIENEHVQYNISVQSPEALILEENILIPGYVSVGIGDVPSFTVAEGVTITTEGALQIHAPLTLNGALVNNGRMVISQRGATVKLDLSDGKYSGSGDLQIIADAGAELAEVLTNPDDFDVREEMIQDDCVIWNLKYAAGLIKLGTPTDLSWGTRYEDDGTGNVASTIAQPGVMSWKTVRPDQARAAIKIYDAQTGECVYASECGFGPEWEPAYRSIEDFLFQDFESGTYYFTIQSLGDYETYRSSDVAVSGTYTYVRPAAQLNPCTTLFWQDRNDGFVSWACFELPENELGPVGFEIAFYFSPEEDGSYEYFAGALTASPYGVVDPGTPLDDAMVQDKGVGYYKFRVRILSPYIEQYCSSEWSDFSPALDVKTIPGAINTALDNLLSNANSNSANPNQIRQDVQSLGTDELKEALLTDQDNTQATAKLAALESLAGGSAAVSVDPSVSAFNATKVSVVGANLNNRKSEDDPITLVLDKPAASHVIPERYDSAVAVSFSMTLDNVADPEKLAVPVKITLPVPESINPEFLVVFHYHMNGEVELLYPYVYEDNGEYFADFVLTSFSDFIMTQEIQESEHEHVFDQEMVEDCYLLIPADCEHPAVYCKSCACGEAGEETFEVGEPLGHCFDGEDSTVCTRCGYKLYAMTLGANQTYHKGCILGLTFRSEARRVKFDCVMVDGEVIGAEHYIVNLGVLSSGTVVMLKASYLNTLDTGDHVITIVSEDGEASAVFTVAQRPGWPSHPGKPSRPGWFETK